MSRFTDPLLFAVLFLLSTATWWILDLNGAIPADSDGSLAPMTVAVAIVIATPSLLFVTVVAFIRALLNVHPRPFWAWMTGATALAALLIWVANLITTTQSIEVGFSTGVWLMSIASVVSLIGLVLALTGAIPTSAEQSPAQAAPVDLPSRRPGGPHLPYGAESPPPTPAEGLRVDSGASSASPSATTDARSTRVFDEIDEWGGARESSNTVGLEDAAVILDDTEETENKNS